VIRVNGSTVEGIITGEDEVIIPAADTFHRGFEFLGKCGKDALLEKWRDNNTVPHTEDRIYMEQMRLLDNWSIVKDKPAFLSSWRKTIPFLDSQPADKRTGVVGMWRRKFLNKAVEL
jgi:hypothetical protein